MNTDNRQNGFTLIEVIVAFLLLTIGILAASSMLIGALSGNSNANRITQAVTWGEARLEALMGKPYTHAELTDTNGNGKNGLNDTDVAGNPADAGPIVTPDNQYTIFWNIADNYPVFGCKTIRALIRRNDKGNIKTIPMEFTLMRPI
jgi:type IV pilus assembly protein PilV